MTYPQSVGNYNITISAQSPPSGNCADPINPEDCEIMVSGTGPDCCNLTCTATGTNETCDKNNDGTATANPVDGTDPLSYLWDDSAAQTTVTATGLSAGTFTVIVTDANGCTSSCSVTIGIDDITPPSITCPADLTLECGDDLNENTNTELSDWLGSATANDTGGSVSVSTSYNSGEFSDDCGNTGTQTVTFTATDNCGLTASCQADVIIEDTTAPTISCPSDVTVECGGDTSSGSTGTATGSDGCGTATISSSDISVPGCGDTEVITRTWTATDECGNTNTCVQTITGEDTTAPSIDIEASDDSVECDGTDDPQGEFEAWLISNGGSSASDGCGNVTWSNNSIGLSDGCGATGTETVTFTATDACGNSSSTSATFTIEDNGLPEIICPSDITIECSESIDPDHTGSATGSDLCGGVTLSYADDIESQGCSESEIINRTWTATDECGNTATCTQIITTQAPEIDVIKIVSVEPFIIGNGAYFLAYEITVENTGETILNNVQLEDDMTLTFAQAVEFNVNSFSIITQPSSTTLVINNNYDGGLTDDNLLDGNGSLLPGEFTVIEITMIVTPGEFLGPLP